MVGRLERAALGDPAPLGDRRRCPRGTRTPGADLVEVLHERLVDRALLLVLDTCEHVVEACADLATQLLPDCPGLDVLATSRERLDVEGEVAYRVPSLLVPPPEQVEHLDGYEAVQLLLDRTTQAGVRIPPDQTVAEICRLLDATFIALSSDPKPPICQPPAGGPPFGLCCRGIHVAPCSVAGARAPAVRTGAPAPRAHRLTALFSFVVACRQTA